MRHGAVKLPSLDACGAAAMRDAVTRCVSMRVAQLLCAAVRYAARLMCVAPRDAGVDAESLR